MHPIYQYGFHQMSYGYGLGSFFLHMLGVFLVIALLILVMRWCMGKPRHWRHFVQPSALEILKERYAKGEIDKKEFEEKRKDLLDSAKDA